MLAATHAWYVTVPSGISPRRDDGPEIMFTSITFFTSLDAIRGFAGDDFELAVVEETARQALSRWDERVSHHQVVADLE